MVTPMHRYVPVPVEVPDNMTLFRQRRDVGITTTIVTAIIVAAVGATVSTVALSSTVQTASALNNLSMHVALTLDLQMSLNSQ